MKVNKVCQKGSGKVNEDALVVRGSLFGVIDGAGSLVPWHSVKGETGGQLAARIVERAFRRGHGALRNILLQANREITAQMRRMHVDTRKKENRWATAVAAVHLRDKKGEFACISDSLILLILKNGDYKMLVHDYDHDQRTLRLWAKFAKSRVKNIYPYIVPQNICTRRLANKQYGSLNGEPTAMKFVQHGTFSLKNVQSIILFTDGLFLPRTNPSSPDDWGAFASIYKRSGLRGLVRHVRRIQRSDPNCWKYPRFKMHDDIAAISIDL